MKSIITVTLEANDQLVACCIWSTVCLAIRALVGICVFDTITILCVEARFAVALKSNVEVAAFGIGTAVRLARVALVLIQDERTHAEVVQSVLILARALKAVIQISAR